MSKPNHSPGVPELLRSIAAALDELSTGDPYDYSRIPSDDARALRALADRFEKPTEAMLEAMLAAHRNPGAMGQTIEAWHQYKVGNAARMFIAAIAAASEGL